LPNLLAGKELVPELIQDKAQPEIIGQKVLDRLHKKKSQHMQDSFTDLHHQLKCNASERAAEAVSSLLESTSTISDRLNSGD